MEYTPCIDCGMTCSYDPVSDSIDCTHCEMWRRFKFGVKQRVEQQRRERESLGKESDRSRTSKKIK